MGVEHVCGDDSFKYPVNVTISSDEEISKDRLMVFNCISTRGVTTGDWWTAGCGYRLLGYGEQDVKSYGEKETCLKYLWVVGARDGYKTVTLKKGTYYIIISDFPQEWGCFYNVRKITEIWSKSDFMATRYKNKQDCENAGYSWCSLCDENEYIRSILSDGCVLQKGDCGYTDKQNCACHNQNTCGQDDECQLVNGYCTSKIDEEEGCKKAGGIWYPKCSGANKWKINKWKRDVCVFGGEDPEYTCSKECGAECETEIDCPYGIGWSCSECACVFTPIGP
jgi:hypothetical protein